MISKVLPWEGTEREPEVCPASSLNRSGTTFLQGRSCAETRKSLSDAKQRACVHGKKKKIHCGLLHESLWGCLIAMVTVLY